MSNEIEKKRKDRKSTERIAVLLPFNGSHPYFLRSVVQLTRALGISVRLLISSAFLKDKSYKEGFYTEFLEEEGLRSSLSWDKKVFEDSLSTVFQSLSPEKDFLAILKDQGSSLRINIAFKNVACPVLVIPETFNRDFRRVMLAYVGGRFSEKALGIAALLGKYSRQQVEVLTIGSVSSPSLRVAHSRAQYFFEMWKVKANYQMSQGPVKQTLLEICDSEKVDLLILGASESEEWKDHRFRLLSHAVAEEAKCPVMVVK